VDASLFSPYSSSDHRYLIAKAYITFYNENPRQRIRGILIDVDSGWTFSINPERLDYFVQTGDRTYLPQPPNLDPKVPEKPYADSGLTAILQTSTSRDGLMAEFLITRNTSSGLAS
jgi:hypothetical protein